MKPARVIKLLLLPLLFMAGTTIAQPPPAIPVQGVAKDALGNPAKNRKVFVKDAIIPKKINNAPVWEETFEVQTNEDGVYTINVGLGTKSPSITIPSIDKIDWANGPYFFNTKVAVAPAIPAPWWTQSDNYIDLGTTQMMTVPYAFFAGNATVTNVSANITPGPPNTFLLTDTLGNVTWGIPRAAQYSSTTVTKVTLSIGGRNIDILPNSTTKIDINMPGVLPGDPILATPLGDYVEWTVYSAWCETADIVKVRFANFTENLVHVQGSQYKILVIK